MKKKIMVVFGTRPEAIKMAPIVLALKKQPDEFETLVVVTAQHREMLDQVLKIFEITPDIDLDIMRSNQSLSQITSNVLTGMEEVFKQYRPNLVLVHGDTTTAYATSLAAFYQQIPIGHVEAGLRTWQKYSPYPEEMNRQMIDNLTDIFFAPTGVAQKNLERENHLDNVFVTGNTAIDALKYTVKTDYQHKILDEISKNQKLILLTMHRRENLGKPMEAVFKAIRKLVDDNEDVVVVYPVHLNPVVKAAANQILNNHSRIKLIEPLDVFDFHNFAARSYLILTDSGGVQEEAPSLGAPVLVLRDTTERPEGVSAGTLKLVGTNYTNVYESAQELIKSDAVHQKMAQAKNPYGDGFASERIIQIISEFFNKQ